ncbi:MAG TPA: transglycosylase SLT domain-containing protein [Burkholderiaceae bacterium]|nr:transglycosylase SLT domain-containing protein [Burkholderiaceae bacterium]
MTMAVYRRAAAFIVAGIALCAALSPAIAQRRPIPEPTPDDTFVALRDAARAGDAVRANDLAARLPAKFDIPSYVEYYRLRARMFEPGGAPRIDTPDEEIRAFLSRWNGEAIADRMRNDWLLALGKRGDVARFEEQYPLFVLKDDPQVTCYAQTFRARRELEQAQAVMRERIRDDAREALADPRQYTDACVALIETMAEAKVFDQAELWRMVRNAYAVNAVSQGRRVASVIARADLDAVDQVAERGKAWLARATLNSQDRREIALLALVRMARADPKQAASELARVESSLRNEDRAWMWAHLGEAAARRAWPEAYAWFQRADEFGPINTRGDESLQWQIRAALRVQDWAMVRSSAERMSESGRRDPAWIYWHARALLAEKKRPEDAVFAQAQFEKLADDFSFYGQLATEQLGRAIVAPPRAAPVTDQELSIAASHPGLARALRFYALNWRFEGNREWNWSLREMNDRQLLAAAEFARRKEVYDRTVNTADRTRAEHDFAQRYLRPWRDAVARAAKSAGLDEAWVYGLIRQESRFVTNARSSVGASGLMQLMPATARYVAKRIGLPDDAARRVDDIATNVTLGTAYLRMAFDDLGGSRVLASAAYNAGPSRARQWRGSLAQPVEGAIFAEMIPFAETRDYVKKVLANTVYYAALAEGRPQSLRAWLGQIGPAPSLPIDELP